jgi:hypothetical protein
MSDLGFYSDCFDIAIQNDYCYTASGDSGVYIFDISDPYNTQLINKIQPITACYGVSVYNNLVLITDHSYGLRIIDVSDILNPIELSHFYDGGHYHKVDNKDGFAYITTAFDGLKIVDIRDPSLPFLAGYYRNKHSANVLANENYIILSEYESGLSILRNDLILDINQNINQQIKIYTLSQNYPNPFNPNTLISYRLPVTSNVTLKVYDVLGNEIATLVNEEKQPGAYEVEFDATDLTSGIYFYQLKAGNYLETRKMVMLK